jgi:hypothetical protein
MKMFKQAVRFFKNRYVILLSVIITLSFVSIYFFLPVSKFEGATWVYSASMQTLATLIALLPISYGYYVANLDNEKNEDFDSYVIDRLKKDVYYDMMTVIFFSIFVILVNLMCFFALNEGLFTYLVAYLTTISIGHISIYIYRLFDPHKVSEILKEFDIGKIDPTQKNISLDQFITDYLELESEVKDLITNENDNDLLSNIPLYDIVDLYSKDYPEIEVNYMVFKEIIFHRNNLIHNYSDVNVDYAKYLKLINLKKVFQDYNNKFIQKNIFSSVSAIKKQIEEALSEFQLNDTESIKDIPLEIISLLHSHFISDYYDCVSDVANLDVDFEINQNNYSGNKLVGINIKQVLTKNVYNLAKSFFKRFEDRYMYLVSIFYISKAKEFIVYYQTSDKQIKKFVVPFTEATK